MNALNYAIADMLDAVEARQSGPAHADRTANHEPSRMAYVMAEEEVCSDVELIADWIAGESGVARQPSGFFGQISSDELVKLAFSDRCTAEQVLQVVNELRTRYVVDKASRIQDRALEISQ